MFIMKMLIIAGGIAIFSGCSSAPRIGVEHAGEERVLSRIDDLGSRPSWVTESNPFQIRDGQVTSLGMTTIPADNRVEAAYRISDNSGKAALASAITQKLEFIFQGSEEGTAMDATQARYIGAESSKLVTSSIRSSRHYWEKVAITQANGQLDLRIRAFSLVSMPENDFKAAIVDAIRRNQGKAGISAEFAKKVDQHWDQFVGAKIDDRKPAANQPTSGNE